MREIKFRGKAMLSLDYLDMIGADHDEGWLIGNLITNNGNPYIVGDIVEVTDEYINHEFWVQVEPESVGQCTGLKDKNGLKIYEGDLYHQGDKNILYMVVYHGTAFTGKQIRSSSYAGLEHWQERIEVIGNIYKNPELLEVLK